MGCNVKVSSQEGTMMAMDPQRLVDGYVNARPIIDTYQWLNGLSKREALERELATVDTKLLDLNRAIERSWKYALGLVLLVLFGVVLWLVVRIRLARVRAVRGLRNQISRDLHDDVGCNLGSIALGISNLKDEVNDPLLEEEFEELELITRETSVALEEAVFFTQRGQVSIVDFVARLEQRAKVILGEKEGVFTVEGELPDQSIDLRIKRQIALIFKEALYNSARHAHATKVDVLISVENHRFHLRIKDNGVGFDPNELDRISGLDNMRKRAEKAGGEFTVQSAPGKGTSLEVAVDY